MKHDPKNHHLGLSLLELLITLMIISVFVLIAVPSFSHYRARLEYQNLYYAIHQQIQIARSQALISHQDVVICSSNDLIHCQNKQWSTGLLVYIDINKDRLLNPDEIIISRLDTDLKFGNLNWYGNASHPEQLVFQSDTGLPRGSNGRFRYCSLSHSNLHVDLQLSQMGHLRSSPTEAC